MKLYKYKVKPEIKTIEDLIVFVKAIPATRWAIEVRDDDEGRCCILGHLDKAYGYGKGRDGLTDQELAVANNGRVGPYANSGEFLPDVDLTSKGTKKRVLKFLEDKLASLQTTTNEKPHRH